MIRAIIDVLDSNRDRGPLRLHWQPVQPGPTQRTGANYCTGPGVQLEHPGHASINADGAEASSPDWVTFLPKVIFHWQDCGKWGNVELRRLIGC
eukprot:1321357-Rhodomonas_salina.1